MRYPWANSLLLLLLLGQLITGFAGFLNGQEMRAWQLWLHSIGAYAISFLLLWKGSIIFHAYAKRKGLNVKRLAFAGLLTLLFITLISGFLWTFLGWRTLFGFSIITLHIFIAISLSLLLIWHIWHFRWIVQVPKATDRRAFLRLGGLGLVGLILWRGSSLMRQLFSLPGASRRFTGSYETGSFSGVFPHVSWIADKPPHIDPSSWRLVIDGSVKEPTALSREMLQKMKLVERTAILDCTGGWYSEQVWRGITVSQIIQLVKPQQDTRSISFISHTGYRRRFSLEQARHYLLALEMAGQPLSRGHGYPLRLVASGQRGVQWVKWLTHIQFNTSSEYWQLPLPIQ